MGFLADLSKYWRFSTDLPAFLRRTISLEESRDIVKNRLASREESFLRLVKRGIFDNPWSPYLPMLHQAGYDLEDIQTAVRQKGLEGTLAALREAGVYTSYEEFKGLEPIVRDGVQMKFRAKDFDNPYLKRWYLTESSGSTGAVTRIPMDLDFIVDQAPDFMLAHHTHGVLGAPTAIWRGPLPDPSGVCNLLRSAMIGHLPVKWFTPFAGHEARPSIKNRLLNRYIIFASRISGLPFPDPEPVGFDEAAVIARWAGSMVDEKGSCLIRAHVSLAMRISLAARHEGIDLTGATFMGGGEPPTIAKVREITSSGAHWVPVYFISEVGPVGVGCANPEDGNDLHVFKDALAVIQYPRRVPGSGATVDSFHFTTLLPSAPKIMLNVESDDYGVMTARSCGCPLEACGLTEHIGHVRSYRKLTGEGVTLVGSEILRILEETLPSRFGGSPLDYQLREEEDSNGFTRLLLLVSPRVTIADEREIVNTVLGTLGDTGVVWGKAGTLEVRREEPVWTSRGKFMPLSRPPDVTRPAPGNS